MSGYANPLCFKDVDDSDIVEVEKFVRENTFKILQNKLSESIDEKNCDILIDDEQLNEYFGPVYQHAPINFKFLPGEIKLIKQLASHVKQMVDSNGINTGLKLFRPKRLLKRANQNNNSNDSNIKYAKSSNEIDEAHISELLPEIKSSLFSKVIDILKQYKVDEKINIDNIDSSIASVVVKNNQVYGDIRCLLCHSEKNDKQQHTKRISYKFTNGYRFWIPSNFTSHLKNKHKLSAERKKNEKKNPDARMKCSNVENENNANESLQMIDVEILDQTKILKPKIQNLYGQITTQISSMSRSVLENSDEESEMVCMVSANETITIKVVAAPNDGNCLFTSLAHQLFRHNMKCIQMKNETVQLRAKVVDHIQKNISLYKHELQGRIYDIKDDQKSTSEHTYSESDSFDMEKEIQFFVYQLLPKNGYWGGQETLLAVSDIFKVNIIVFLENELFMVINREGSMYKKTISVAYRFSDVDNRVRNHYDSVTDIESHDIYALTDC